MRHRARPYLNRVGHHGNMSFVGVSNFCMLCSSRNAWVTFICFKFASILSFSFTVFADYGESETFLRRSGMSRRGSIDVLPSTGLFDSCCTIDWFSRLTNVEVLSAGPSSIRLIDNGAPLDTAKELFAPSETAMSTFVFESVSNSTKMFQVANKRVR